MTTTCIDGEILYDDIDDGAPATKESHDWVCGACECYFYGEAPRRCDTCDSGNGDGICEACYDKADTDGDGKVTCAECSGAATYRADQDYTWRNR